MSDYEIDGHRLFDNASDALECGKVGDIFYMFVVPGDPVQDKIHTEKADIEVHQVGEDGCCLIMQIAAFKNLDNN